MCHRRRQWAPHAPLSDVMSTPQVGSSLAIADMHYNWDTGVRYPIGGDSVVKVCRGLYNTMLEPKVHLNGCSEVCLSHHLRDGQGVLEGCPKLIGLLLVSRLDYFGSSFRKLLTYMPNTLCVLQMHSCHMSYDVLLEIGRVLPHLQMNTSTLALIKSTTFSIVLFGIRL